VGVLADEPRFVDAACVMADAVAAAQRMDGGLPGRLGSDWQAAVRWSCLTGNAQMAIIWLRLNALIGELRWRTYAMRAISFVQSTQSCSGSQEGAVAGSYPVWGGYMTWCHPSWAVKFFMDAIMLSETSGWSPNA
jgi:hypothetical protein